MTSDVALDHAPGYLHEVGFYASDEEFRDLICPFALNGVDAGEPVVFAYDTRKMDLLHRWLPDEPSITYITDVGPYATPTKALASWRKVIEGHLAAGAPRVRIAGNVPHPGYGRPYAGWDRYEAAVDRAIGDLPVWAPCLYDARIAPVEVLDAAARLHDHVLGATGEHRASGSFSAVRRLADFLSPEPDPLEKTVPTLELVNPTAGLARGAVARVVEGLLSGDRHDDLILGLSEAVSNAIVHGEPPVTVRVWLGANRVVVTIHDEGQGPVDPLTGLLPMGENTVGGSGLGLWLTHQLDIDAALAVAADGFTVRLSADI